ncbi:MAG: 1,6-anhydro-N-acetylmuramyl-L-alanine amidase AmpD [Candidatus Thiodiazotropha endolucinida]
MLQSEDVLLGCAEFHPSENMDDRSPETEVDLLVIHSISLPPGEFGGGWIDDLFMNKLDVMADPYFAEIKALKVSCHLLIQRTGKITQYVPLNRRAWHAGESHYCGRSCCNDFSIGIELEGSDEIPFTDDQYQALQQVTREVMHHYPAITRDRITSHAAIAPGRKTDPGPMFDWPRYLDSISAPE